LDELLIAVRGCGGESEDATCPKCQKPKADLGWRVGDSLYSSIERLPKKRGGER
jgi:hypothetical protein